MLPGHLYRLYFLVDIYARVWGGRKQNRGAPTRGGGRSIKEETDESEEDFWSEGSECEPANVEADSVESEGEAPDVFPRCAPAAATVGRPAKSPLWTPPATSEGKVASPVPRSTAGVSRERATPLTANIVHVA